MIPYPLCNQSVENLLNIMGFSEKDKKNVENVTMTFNCHWPILPKLSAIKRAVVLDAQYFSQDRTKAVTKTACTRAKSGLY